MSKKKSKPESSDNGSDEKRPPKRKESARETVESIVFAFVLAFLFRTFEAEAFVIPTGSMAPTLYGRHKELDCEQCGYHFTIGASDELNEDTGHLHAGTRIESAICPNCRFENDSAKRALAFNGDRILVNKYPYEFGEPDRWDVFVFKFPLEPKTNFIKRLAGLPNEIVRIRDGDIYTVDEIAGERIQRKPADKQSAIQIDVYDDDHPPGALLDRGWPERWSAVRGRPDGEVLSWTAASDTWTHDPAERVFHVTPDSADDLAWLRYQHLVATPDDWTAVLAGQDVQPRPTLITDFCGYNAYIGTGVRIEQHSPREVDYGPFWVGDLTLDFELSIDTLQDGAEIVIELCEGVYWYRCRIDPQTGTARLTEVNVQFGLDRERDLASARTPVSGSGTWDLTFANVDDRLVLWVDGDSVDFGDGALLQRDSLSGTLVLQSDLAPVGIAVKNAAASVRSLKLQRDIYYRVDTLEHHFDVKQVGRQLASVVHDPAAWSEIYERFASEIRQVDFRLGPDEFLALGDNSPRSRDSRLWETGPTVPRKFLVGKAFWIYWPHGVPFLNDDRGIALKYNSAPGEGKLEDYPKYTVPFYPQVWRMNRIR